MKSPDGVPPAGEGVLLSAISDVAESSFFAMVEPCDDERFARLADPNAAWLSAAVRFEEPDGAGTLTCWLPASLADRLCDAFMGRDPDAAPATSPEVHDLAGEFANMICGAWMTRLANDRTFVLYPPVVTQRPLGIGAWTGSLQVSVDGQPCLVEIRFDVVAETV